MLKQLMSEQLNRQKLSFI